MDNFGEIDAEGDVGFARPSSGTGLEELKETGEIAQDANNETGERTETDPSSRMDTTESGVEPPSPKQAAQGAAIKR